MSLRLGRFNCARSGTTRGAAGERQQSYVAGAFDGHPEPALVTCADAGHTAGKNLAALLHELGKNVGALVVDQIDLFDTELADFLLAEELALAARPSTRASAGTARTAFTASATAARTTFAAPTTAAVASVSSVSTTRTAFAAWRWRWR
jgi:hypothetical protein